MSTFRQFELCTHALHVVKENGTTDCTKVCTEMRGRENNCVITVFVLAFVRATIALALFGYSRTSIIRTPWFQKQAG